jgi:ABC-type glycerol-3-phosphate transport system substrate-binding protein
VSVISAAGSARRRRRNRFGALLGVVAMAGAALTACASRSTDPKVVTYWTTITDPITMKAWNAIAAGFEKENPGYKVQILPKPSLGTGDATSLITAVRGHTGPDAYLVDRFTTAQYAATGLLQDLQPYVDKSPGMKSKYLQFAWNEGSFKGDAYGIPNDTDSRGLFYNKTLLKKAGINPDVLDPKNGPPTIDEIMNIAKKTTIMKGGTYKQIGLIPWDAQGFFATWALAFGAKYFDNSTCKIDLTDKGQVEAFNDFAKWAKQLNYTKVSAFLATYLPPGHPPQQGTFFDSNVAMTIDGNFNIEPLKQYAPKLDYGVTYLPVAKKGDPPFTWSGGFAYVMPKGAANPAGGWKFIKYAAGPEGQKIYDVMTQHLPTYKSLLNDKQVTGSQQFFADILKYSTSRPALPINAQLSNALGNAQTAVLLGGSPQAALNSVYKQVQPNMQQFCPFKLPKTVNSSQ